MAEDGQKIGFADWMFSAFQHGERPARA